MYHNKNNASRVEKALKLFLIALILTGCNMVTTVNWAISSDMPAVAQEAAIKALNDWCELEPSTCGDVYIGEPKDGYGYIYVNDTLQAVGVTYQDSIRIPQIGIRSVDEDGKAYNSVQHYVHIAHELGHALSGRIDHLPDGNIMAKTVTGQSAELTKADHDYILGFK